MSAAHAHRRGVEGVSRWLFGAVDDRGSGGEASRRERRLVGRGGSHDVVVGVDVADVAVGGPLARPRLLPLRGERRRRLAPASSSSAPGRVRPEWPVPTGTCRRSGRRSPCSSVRASRPQVGSGLSGPAPEGACRRRGRCLACCSLFLCL